MISKIEYKICRNKRRGWRCYNPVPAGVKYCNECRTKKELQKYQDKINHLPSEVREHLETLPSSLFQTQKTNIYFIQLVNGGPIKIGYAKNITRRLNALQVAHAYPLKLLHSFQAHAFVELALHYKFKKLRLLGEWFEPSHELLYFIENIKNGNIPEDIQELIDNPRT